MATVNVHWAASKKLLAEELVATGQAQNSDRYLTIDLVALTQAQRAAILAHVEASSNETLATIDLTKRLQDDLAADRYERSSFVYDPVYLDAEPTVEQVVAHLKREASRRAILEDEAKAIRQARREREQRATEIVASVKAEIKALKAAGDLDGLRAYTLPAEWWSTLTDQERTREGNLAASAIAAILDDRRNQDMAEWIPAHGSDRLKRAHAAGYDCKRLYVVERAAVEAPDYVADYDDNASWNRRSSPTTAALDALDAAAALGLGKAEIVWLTKPARSKPARDEWDEDFDPCEAVVIRGYLGKYDLVKVV